MDDKSIFPLIHVQMLSYALFQYLFFISIHCFSFSFELKSSQTELIKINKLGSINPSLVNYSKPRKKGLDNGR